MTSQSLVHRLDLPRARATLTSVLAAGAGLGALGAPAWASNFSVSGPGLAIPASGSGDGAYQTTQPTAPSISGVTVSRPVTSVTSVVVTGITHTWVGDLQIVLKDPSGAGHNLMVRPGFTGVGFGNSGDFLSPGQNITFVPSGGATIPDANPTNIATGIYDQHQCPAPWNNGNFGISNTNLASIAGPAGTWSLVIYDWANGDMGTFTGWTLNGTDTSPSSFCEPGVAGVNPCPCGNPGGGGVGCSNSGSPGAVLGDTGSASLSADTIVFTGASMFSGSACILLQGDALVPAGTGFGDGVRCTGGNLKRLWVKPIVGGSASAPAGGDITVSAKSAALGDTISAGQTRYYQVYYRDPGVSGCLLGSGQTFNVSSGRIVFWNP